MGKKKKINLLRNCSYLKITLASETIVLDVEFFFISWKIHVLFLRYSCFLLFKPLTHTPIVVIS